MERTGTGIGSLHFAIGSHRGVDVNVLVATFGLGTGFGMLVASVTKMQGFP